MTRLKILLVFISLFGLRWVSLDSPLPETWTPQSRIRYTAWVIEQPEYTGSKTIIRSGRWEIRLKGYAEIVPGSRVMFVGKAIPKVLGGKVVKIVMEDPTFEVVDHTRCVGTFHAECVLITLGEWRGKWVGILRKTLPEPMSSLAAGILLGVKGQMPYEFYQQLIKTGTLHIVAASGFNVMVVASVLMQLLSKVFLRGWAIAGGVGGIIVYVLLSGVSASVVRAGIMGSLTLIAYYLGRPAEARRLLWVSAGLMLLYSPLYMVDVGFQLSVGATVGLLYLGSSLKILQSKILKFSNWWLDEILQDYLYPTLAATMATAPVIWWHFGRLSLISILVNMLILPVVPLIMLLSALTLIGGQMMAWVAYVPLAYLVWVIRWWGG